LAQVHFYRKDEPQGSAETMETLVHKTNVTDRNPSGTAAGSHVQYTSMPNTNVASATAPIILSQPAPMAKVARPVRDNAQFVSVNRT
jgi:hypothetical protein